MPNPEISQITLPTGTTYDLKDAKARSDIESITGSISGGMHYIGVSSTALSDGATTNPITIDGTSVTAKGGDIAIYGQLEFIWNPTSGKWQEFGSTGSLKALAFKDKVTASYKPAGTVSKPTFTGSSSAVTITATNNNSGNYQPAGTVSKPTFTGSESSVTVTATANTDGNYQPAGTVSKPSFTGASMTSTGKFTPDGSVTVTTNATTNKTATVSAAASGTTTYQPGGTNSGGAVELNTTTVNSITAVGTLPSWTATVANENLTLGWSAGTLPTKGSNTTVATSVKTFTQPTFTGTAVRLVTGNIAVPNTYTATFTGEEGNVSVSGTTTGSVSQPTFTGTKVQLAGTTTAAGSVSQPTFTGTKVQLEGTTTAAGSVSQPTFTGTKVQLAGTTTAAGSVSQPTFTGTQSTIEST